jgi:succinyl-diaminopimelate desuccinylase
LLRTLESREDEIATLCSELVKLPTPNPPGDTAACAAYIQRYFEAHDVPATIHARVDGKANLCARIAGADPRTLLWMGHIDVVPPGDPTAWRDNPYSGRIADGHVYGRGASDMKGSCAAAMVAATTLHDAGTPPYTLEFWFTCDEEIGGQDGAKWLANDGRIDGDACLIGDSSGSTAATPYIDVGCKSVFWVTLRADGRTAHGATPYLGINALEKLLAVIARVKTLGAVPLPVPADLQPVLETSVDFLLGDAGLTAAQRDAVRRVYQYPTVSLNILRGGVKVNVVPDQAEARIDIRLTPGANVEDVKRRVQTLIDTEGVDGITVAYQTGVGYYESPHLAFTQQLRDAVARASESRVALKVLTGGTDAINLKPQGIPCLGFGAGLRGMAHTPNEHVSIANLVLAAKVYALFPTLYAPR